MRWPWKPKSEDVHRRKEAERKFHQVMADWPQIEAVTGVIREHRVRNHIVERAFALREKGGDR